MEFNEQPIRPENKQNSIGDEWQSALVSAMWSKDTLTGTENTSRSAQQGPERNVPQNAEELRTMVLRFARERRELGEALDRAAQATFPDDSLSQRRLQALGAAICNRDFRALESLIKNSDPQDLRLSVQALNRNLQDIPLGRNLQISCTIRQMPTLNGLDAQGAPSFAERDVAFVLIGARNELSRVVSIPQVGTSEVLRSSPGSGGQRVFRRTNLDVDIGFRLTVTDAINGTIR